MALITFGVLYFNYIGKYEVDTKTYPRPVGYIETSTSLLNDVYDLCDANTIYGLHSPRHLEVYEGSKARFRESILNSFNDTIYSDSGYVTFRFIINCKGQPGWFEILQTNLDYEEAVLEKNLINHLLEITKKPENWAVRTLKSEAIDYYMYITYRIKNGKIAEILP